MLASNHIEIIKDCQLQSILEKKLIKNQLDLIYEQKWFNMWVPKVYSGLALSLTKGLSILEEIAYWDGGLGWTVTLCSGANMFAGYIDPALATTIFADRMVCWGGSGRVGGTANLLEGDMYEISGEWQYATGSPHLTHFTLNCYIYKDGFAQHDEEGRPLIKSFFVKRDDVLIHYDWDCMGLECTASHSFSISYLQIPVTQSFFITSDRTFYPDKLHRYPFITFAQVTLLVNYIGMYRRFLDLTEKYFFTKSSDTLWTEKYAKKRFRLIDTYRDKLTIQHTAIDEFVTTSWQNIDNENYKLDPIYENIQRISQEIVSDIRQNVMHLYPLTGIQGSQRHNEINIVFRNIFTATQHSLLNIID